MRKVQHTILSALLLALATSLPLAAAAEDGPFSIWWSPALELDSLDAIDARLERELWEGGSEGLPLIKSDGDTSTEVRAVNCVELEKLAEEGYEGRGSHGRWAHQYLLSYCKAIEMLKSAGPAGRSFVREFTYDLESVHYLPAMVYLSQSCDMVCREVVANERRISLSRFHDIRLIQIISQTEMKYWSEDWQIRLVSLVRADLTQDGVEDMLVLSSGGSISGTGSWAELFLLTRFGPDEVLKIVNAEQYLCAGYQCRSSYDYPEVLRETSDGNAD